MHYVLNVLAYACAVLILTGLAWSVSVGEGFSKATLDQGVWIHIPPPPDSTFVACWKQNHGPENTIVVCQ